MKSLKNILTGIIPKSLSTFIYDIIVPYFKNTNRKKYAKYGQHVELTGPLHLYSSQVSLDNFTRLQPGITIISNNGRLTVKKFSAIGANCVIIPGAHTPTVGLPQYLSTTHINDKEGEIIIEEDCWVAAGCYLLSHAHIGRGSVVAAGSIVTKEVPPYAVVAGSPAKIIATRFSIEQIIKHEAILYPPEERMTKDSIEQLFKTFYEGKKHIGTDEISKEDAEKLVQIKKSIEMPIYE